MFSPCHGPDWNSYPLCLPGCRVNILDFKRARPASHHFVVGVRLEIRGAIEARTILSIGTTM